MLALLAKLSYVKTDPPNDWSIFATFSLYSVLNVRILGLVIFNSLKVLNLLSKDRFRLLLPDSLTCQVFK